MCVYDSGAKPREGRGQYSHGVARPEQVRDPGHRWRPGSGHRASEYLGHLKNRGAWTRRRRAARQGRAGREPRQIRAAAPRGSAPTTAVAARAGERAGGGSAAAAAAAREAPAPQASRASSAAAAAATRWPCGPPIRGARGGGACAGGAGARAGRPAGGF